MTKRGAFALTTIAVLTLSAWLLWSTIHRGEAADIQHLADLVAKKEDGALKKEAEKIAKRNNDLGTLMKLFKARTKEGGGLGVGKKAGVIQPDGIEAKIKELAKKGASAAELDEQGGDLIRLAYVTAAIALVTKHKCEVDREVGYLKPADWGRWSEGMQQASLDLAEAVQDGDGARVKAAAAKLSSHCTSCHRIFRE
jgi:hypothetical protein